MNILSNTPVHSRVIPLLPSVVKENLPQNCLFSDAKDVELIVDNQTRRGMALNLPVDKAVYNSSLTSSLTKEVKSLHES